MYLGEFVPPTIRRGLRQRVAKGSGEGFDMYIFTRLSIARRLVVGKEAATH
jgi:hypothetical protein